MYKNTLSPQEEKQFQQQVHIKKQILTELYGYLVRAKVDGLMSLQEDIDDFENETNVIVKYYKRAINMRIIFWDYQDLKDSLLFYKEKLLLNYQIKNPQEVELIMLIDSVLESFYSGDVDDFFSGALFATQYFTQSSYDSLVVKKVLYEIGKLKAQLVYNTQDYPIKLDEKYPEWKKRIDEKLQFFEDIEDYDIQKLIREIYAQDMVNMLGLCQANIKDKFIKNMQHIAAGYLLEDVEKKFFEFWDEKPTFEQIQKSIDTILQSWSELPDLNA